MTSKLKTDVLETVSGSGTIALNNQLSGMTSASVPSGSVLQVVSTTYTGTISSTSATPVDVSGFSATITPSSTSSKILVSVDTQIGWDTGDAYPYVLLLRGSTSIGTGVGASGVQINTFISAPNLSGNDTTTSQYKMESASKAYLDSPATTSSTTYKIQFAQPFGGYAAFINRQSNQTNNAYVQYPASTITLTEIKG